MVDVVEPVSSGGGRLPGWPVQGNAQLTVVVWGTKVGGINPV
jgi:hypothetical protein